MGTNIAVSALLVVWCILSVWRLSVWWGAIVRWWDGIGTGGWRIRSLLLAGWGRRWSRVALLSIAMDTVLARRRLLWRVPRLK